MTYCRHPSAGRSAGAMRLNQPSERSAIRFLPDVPVVNPCELPQRDAAAGFGHPCQPKVDAIGEDRGEQCVAIIGGSATALVGEAL